MRVGLVAEVEFGAAHGGQPGRVPENGGQVVGHGRKGVAQERALAP